MCSDTSGRGTSRTVRTEVTLERESITLTASGAKAAFDLCPLCGQMLAPAQGEQAGLRLQKDSTNREYD